MKELNLNIIPSSTVTDLHRTVNNIMEKSSMFYRLFARRKDNDSASKKIKKKGYDKSRKMQDLFGVRIALYFKDDIPICKHLIENSFEVVDVTEDEEKTSDFSPVRLNYVCKLPENIKKQIDNSFWEYTPIDDTFEIQIRTVFSEGWHEIEHDLRYKCKEDWNEELEMSRALNGIFATLETCDWSILSLFDKLAYKNYIASNWEVMLRNKLRIRIKPQPIDNKIRCLFYKDKKLVKDIFKIDRENLILKLSTKELSSIPKTYNNIIYIANYLYVKNNDLIKLTPQVLCNKLKYR